MNSWGLMQWLDGFAYFVAIMAAISGGILFIIRSRRKLIEMLRHDLDKTWTNEGDISSGEPLFITLNLNITDGDLIGSLSTNRHDRRLEARVNVGWGKAKLCISEPMGNHTIPVGEVRLRLVGNRNRLKWHLIGNKGNEYLPKDTLLWPIVIYIS